MNAEFFVKKAVAHALKKWKPAGTVETAADLIEYFDPVEIMEIVVNVLVDDSLKEGMLENLYAVCNQVIDEAVGEGEMTRAN